MALGLKVLRVSLKDTSQKAEASGYYNPRRKKNLLIFEIVGFIWCIVNITVESFASPKKQDKFRTYILGDIRGWSNQNPTQSPHRRSIEKYRVKRERKCPWL